MATATITPDGSEIILRDAKPAFEWILGRAIRKMSPRGRHAVLQARVAKMIDRWANGRGRVGTEWHQRVAPPGEIRRPLVPDVAYASAERYAAVEADVHVDGQPTAAEIVVEVLSPGDRREYLEHKRDVYLVCGAVLMIVIDPGRRSVETFDVDGGHAVASGDAVVTSRLFPGLSIALTELFEVLDPPSG